MVMKVNKFRLLLLLYQECACSVDGVAVEMS